MARPKRVRKKLRGKWRPELQVFVARTLLELPPGFSFTPGWCAGAEAPDLHGSDTEIKKRHVVVAPDAVVTRSDNTLRDSFCQLKSAAGSVNMFV